MAFTKAKIFNLALQALLLQRQISNADTDPSIEAKVLRTNWDAAFALALEDMDLDSTASQVTASLIEEDPNLLWSFAYTYPTDCAKLRRLQSYATIDNRDSHIPKQVRIHDGDRVIFSNEADAVLEYISTDIDISALSASAAFAVSQRLAMMCAPLITGKGADQLMKRIADSYKIAKAEAQAHDKEENFNNVDEAIESEFVNARTS